MGVVFSLQEPLEREIIFHKKVATYIWFYLVGWFTGPGAILIALFVSLLIITFKIGEQMVAGIDVVVIAD